MRGFLSLANDAPTDVATTESSPPPSYEKLQEETQRWYTLFCLYRNAGPTRSLMGALHQAEAMKGKAKQSKSVPGAWWKAYQRHEWKARAEAYDAHLRAENEATIKRIMTEGLAAAHTRVSRLTQMIDVMELALLAGDSLSARLVEQWRGALDDIAREVGGRNTTRRHEITGKDGGPMETKTQVVFYVPEVDQEDGDDPLALLGEQTAET